MHLSAAELVLRPLLFAALVALAFVPLESLFPARPRTRTRFGRDVLFATAGAVVARALVVLSGAGVVALADAAGLSRGPLSTLPTFVALPLGLVVFDLGGYAYHRASHRAPLLWRLHATHHGSTSMDWLASFRQHPLELALLTTAQNLPLVLLGMPLGTFALLVVLLKLHTVFVHANVRAPRWLAPFVATPHFHHRHHDADAHEANYASLFPWLDRLLGTYDDAEASRFGLAAR